MLATGGGRKAQVQIAEAPEGSAQFCARCLTKQSADARQHGKQDRQLSDYGAWVTRASRLVPSPQSVASRRHHLPLQLRNSPVYTTPQFLSNPAVAEVTDAAT
ncbi:hypothetical protein J1614_005983 [Plenodomus biglobosus]|nr:hypothetical protein J1614_005983 [Plenodomus biglobosus]